MRRIGLLVNPVAGMGGAVALKGTDRPEEALRRGARPVAPERARRFLRALGDATIVTVGGAMGEDACEAEGLSAMVVHAPATPSAPADTVAGARALADAGVDLLVFVGGDGTAALVAEAVGVHGERRAGDGVPALGVPSGVKMYSAVFAETPERAAEVARTFDGTGVADVLDIDEEAFRAGSLRVRLRGALRVPTHRKVQSGKLAGEDDEVEQVTLAQHVAERILAEDGAWILGAGTTMYAVKEALEVPGTLLGVDAVVVEGGKARLAALDAAEKDLLPLPDPLRLVVSPIGAQGFVLGRGNLQVTPAVLRRIGAGNVLVVATPTKLGTTPVLHVDSGEPAIDASFPRYLRVVTGYDRTRVVRLE